MNAKPANCGDCGRLLDAGAGRRWRGERPAWSSGQRSYLCESCYAIWQTWIELLPLQRQAMAEIREWICRQLPGLPMPGLDPAGIPTLLDQRSICQGDVAGVVTDGTWLAGPLVARSISRWLYQLIDPIDDYRDVVEGAVIVRDDTLERLGAVVDVSNSDVWRINGH